MSRDLDIKAESWSLDPRRTADVGRFHHEASDAKMSRFRTCREPAVLVPSPNLGAALCGLCRQLRKTESVEQSMNRLKRGCEIFVIAADGTMLNRGNLPPSDTKRWVRRRKSYVVAAVEGGLLSWEDAYSRYSLTAEEFRGWQRQDHLWQLGRWRKNCDAAQ